LWLKLVIVFTSLCFSNENLFLTDTNFNNDELAKLHVRNTKSNQFIDALDPCLFDSTTVLYKTASDLGESIELDSINPLVYYPESRMNIGTGVGAAVGLGLLVYRAFNGIFVLEAILGVAYPMVGAYIGRQVGYYSGNYSELIVDGLSVNDLEACSVGTNRDDFNLRIINTQNEFLHRDTIPGLNQLAIVHTFIGKPGRTTYETGISYKYIMTPNVHMDHYQSIYGLGQLMQAGDNGGFDRWNFAIGWTYIHLKNFDHRKKGKWKFSYFSGIGFSNYSGVYKSLYPDLSLLVSYVTEFDVGLFVELQASHPGIRLGIEF
jgi:hypothetical protein